MFVVLVPRQVLCYREYRLCLFIKFWKCSYRVYGIFGFSFDHLFLNDWLRVISMKVSGDLQVCVFRPFCFLAPEGL